MLKLESSQIIVVADNNGISGPPGILNELIGGASILNLIVASETPK